MADPVDEWIDGAEDWQRQHLLRLRTIITSTVPEARESLKWNQPCYALNGLFCYLQKAKGHVTLGFQNGARMRDPAGMLKGDGKLMRHLRFGRDTPIDDARCIDFIKQAVALD